MAVMKEMALAQAIELVHAQAGARVEKAVRNVDGPGREGQKDRDPRGQVFAGRPGECERPDDGDGRGVEAGQMPEADRAWGVQRTSACKGRADAESPLRIVKRLRH